MKIGNKEFKIGERTYIMGILDVAPDYFYDGKKFDVIEEALSKAENLIDDGADIIDIGVESTRPDLEALSVEDEIDRVVPIIKAIKERFDIPVSIDTYKAEIAESAIKAGADMINDIWGFKKDKNMAGVAAKYDVPVILVHNRVDKIYVNFMKDVLMDLVESINIALDAGVKRENIILDPGIGFAKSYEEDLCIMNNLEMIKGFELPVLLGASRKAIIGVALDVPEDERVEGTLAANTIGIMKGCDFLRVHDVLESKRAAVMADAIVRQENR